MDSKTKFQIQRSLESQVSEFANKTAPLFLHNKWAWAYPKQHIPSVDDIEVTALTLIHSRELFTSDRAGCVSTGRIQVRWVKYDNRIVASIELIPLCNFSTIHLDD